MELLKKSLYELLKAVITAALAAFGLSSDDLGDGNPNGIDWNVLRKRGKRHDYFTSALPWTQKGQAIELPLGTSAPVTYNATNPHDSYLTGKQAGLWQKGNNTDADRAQACYLGDDDSAKRIRPDLQEPLWLNADLSRATAATINSLRMAFQLQRLLETDARCGTRLCEIIRGHFKTICPDARLQRSEYLGGSSTPIGFLPVAQTAENGDTPQGNLVANAPQSLDVWHLAQRFDTLPTLSKEFIEDNPPLKRVLSVQDEPEIILDAYLGQKWTRPMGVRSIPGLVDHL
ncbi:unnamed protein product [Cylicocyclus nassatus]|uniref:Uncharacterized protein n=1 Tax=Cylicocyclus nassatus TaxID=53992 RepID=A0AA36M772_CYLNA|nr:unnamed protein product [Cylicocyclus nassatus]CAJ0600772.1 unnamed protein product [Cylicocyclus nassatus]